MSGNLGSTSELCKERFERWYREDFKAGTDDPVPWGHSWLESRWRVWKAAWDAARDGLLK